MPHNARKRKPVHGRLRNLPIGSIMGRWNRTVIDAARTAWRSPNSSFSVCSGRSGSTRRRWTSAGPDFDSGPPRSSTRGASCTYSSMWMETRSSHGRSSCTPARWTPDSLRRGVSLPDFTEHRSVSWRVIWKRWPAERTAPRSSPQRSSGSRSPTSTQVRSTVSQRQSAGRSASTTVIARIVPELSSRR